MRPSLSTTGTVFLLLLVFLAGSVVAVERVSRLRSSSTLQEVLYIPSGKVLQRLSLGYSGLMADIYWTRAVQYFGGKHHAAADDYKLLAPLLEITTDLDPHLLVAYQFGASFLSPPPPNGAGLPERAVQLVQKGIQTNPNEWKLCYNLGFIYYLELHDYAKSAEAFEQCSRVPGAHPFVKILAANMAQHAGETGMSRMLWTTTFESTQDIQIKQNAVAHLRALQVDEAVTALEELAEAYRRKVGHSPGSFADLVRVGMLRGIPLDPTGEPYQLKPDGRVEVRNLDDLPFITKGRPPGHLVPSPNFKNIKPELPR